jgi:hypothetical protein
MAKVSEIQLTGRRNTFIWSLQQNGKYTIRSMYRVLAVPNILPQPCYLETEIALESYGFHLVFNQRCSPDQR